MQKLCFEALEQKQKEIFPKLAPLAPLGALAGGTGLALQLGHRKSYDFDIFLSKPIPKNIEQKIKQIFGKIAIINRFQEEFTFLAESRIKITLLFYPFKRCYSLIKTPSLPLFHWRDIALDKAYTLGRRGQYRDYVDLFCVMQKKKITLPWMIKSGEKKFHGYFSEKLFLGQITYFRDLEIAPIEFLETAYLPNEIKNFFEKKVREYLS